MIELVNHGRCAVSAIHDENPTTDRLSSPETQGDATVGVKDTVSPGQQFQVNTSTESLAWCTFDQLRREQVAFEIRRQESSWTESAITNDG